MTIRRLPPLNALRSFEAAARHGSFNRAAEELFVTPSAVSHQIKTLEEFLNQKLFRRVRRKVQLTPSGEKYLISVQHALDEIDSATRRLMASPNVSAVNLNVAPAFLTRWLVPRIGHFQEQHPDVELRLSASIGQVDFNHSDTDMAVYFGRGDWEDVEAHYLRPMVVVPVCSPKLLETKRLASPEDLQQHTLIHVASRADEWRKLLDQAGYEQLIPGKSLTFSNTSLALGAAMEGLGIALADRGLVAREVQFGQLAVPFDLTLDTHKAFYLVYQKNRPLTYGMNAFRDWILTQMQEDEVTTTPAPPDLP